MRYIEIRDLWNYPMICLQSVCSWRDWSFKSILVRPCSSTIRCRPGANRCHRWSLGTARGSNCQWILRSCHPGRWESKTTWNSLNARHKPWSCLNMQSFSYVFHFLRMSQVKEVKAVYLVAISMWLCFKKDSGPTSSLGSLWLIHMHNSSGNLQWNTCPTWIPEFHEEFPPH